VATQGQNEPPRLGAVATAEDIRQFQLHLVESGVSICSRNQMMVGVGFLLRVTLRRLDLAESRPSSTCANPSAFPRS